MKFLTLFATLLAVLPSALAVDQKKSAIVWFEDDSVSDSVYKKVKNDMVRAGGKITHEYRILRGFAVVAPVKALEEVQTMSAEHSIRVEEDQEMSAN